MTVTLTSSGAVILKAGANVSTALTDSDYTEFINQAESFINAATRYNWVDNYAGLDADNAKILDDAASSHAAMAAINYDMSGYTSRAEAQTMLDVNYTRLNDCIQLLKEVNKAGDFLKGT